MPQKTSFAAGWTDWTSQTILREEGYLPTQQPSPWPHFFVAYANQSSNGGLGLLPGDMRQFQDWCNKRAAALPPVIVHSIPYLAPDPSSARSVVRVLTFGLQRGEPRDNQLVQRIGFCIMMFFGLARNADDYTDLPPDVMAKLPRSRLRLETRVRSSEP